MENEAAFREFMQTIVERQAASTKSLVISEEKYDAIRCHLLDPRAKVDPHFRHWVKTRKFQIVDLPGLGLHQILVIPNDKKDQIDGSGEFLQVVHAGDVYDVVKGIHEDELEHGGYKKVKNYVDRHYFGITRGFVQEYCKHCPACQLSQPQVKRPPHRPIIHNDFLERVQVDFIDMRHSPDRHYNYIGHFMDHFSNYHVLFPLRQKSAEEVARLLEERVLACFGPPKIFHSDHGREFVNQLIQALFSRWGGETTFVNGSTYYSQSQGLVDSWNETVKKKVNAMKKKEKIDDGAMQYPWASWLPRIQFSMNCDELESIQCAPYNVVFGRSVPDWILPGAKGCFAEEDVVHVEDQTNNKEDEISQPPPPDSPVGQQAQEFAQPSSVKNPIPTPRQKSMPIPEPQLFKPQPSAENQPSSSSSSSSSSPQPPLEDATNQPSPLPQEDTSHSLSSPMHPEPPAKPENQPSSTGHSTIRKRALHNACVSAAKMPEFYCKRKIIKVQEFSVVDRISPAMSKLD